MILPLTIDQRGQLVQPIFYWLRQLRGGLHRDVARGVVEAFNAYKASKSRRSRKVSRAPMLVMEQVLQELLPNAGASARDVEPWQLAGSGVTCQIDLAFKLWLDNFPPFKNLVEQYGLGQVFSIVGLCNGGVAPLDSLLRLNELLTSLLSADAEFFAKVAKENAALANSRRKSTDGLSRGRDVSKQSRKREAQELSEKAKHLAREYWRTGRVRTADGWRSGPLLTVDDVVAHLRTFEYFAKPSDRWLKDTIKGLKSETLRSVYTETPK